jgi:flagellar biosynthetic protein FliS
MDNGGQVAANLHQLYDFMHRHLATGNARNSAGHVRQVIGLLEDLNSAWRAITD